MSIGADWGGDDDSLAQNMNVYEQVYGQQTAGLKKKTVAQGKSEIKASKEAESAAKEQQAADNRAAGMALAKGIIDTAIQAGTAAVSMGAFDKAGQAAKLADKSAALDVKRQAAVDAGKTAKAANLGKRSINVGRRAQRLSDVATYGSSRKPGLFGPRNRGGSLTDEELDIINSPGTIGSDPSYNM